MNISLSLFSDFMVNGETFAEKGYHSLSYISKDISSEKITSIQKVWEDLETYSLAICIGSAVLACAVTFIAFAAGSPLVGIASIVCGVALGIFSFTRYVVATFEKASWATFEEGQDFETRGKLMTAGLEQRNYEIQQTSDSLQRELDSYKRI
ncbi:MAG: hypothetical protein H0T62_01970 [Parachlamydiaceae bacterium]|nr:hypothetical protein [Parachlamydiaceae bacterium]